MTYLTVTRGVDPDLLERGRMDQALRGWYPSFAEQGPLDGVVFTTIQELATRISHRNTGALTRRRDAEKLCARVATDENLHYVFYRDMAINAIELDPSEMVLAMHRQILNFEMPGAGIPGFRQKAKAMAQAGVYNLRIHLEQVLRPVLDNHFRLAELDGLTDDAERAREEIFEYLERLDACRHQAGRAARPRHATSSSRPPSPCRRPVAYVSASEYPVRVLWVGDGPVSLTLEMTSVTALHPVGSKLG